MHDRRRNAAQDGAGDAPAPSGADHDEIGVAVTGELENRIGRRALQDLRLVTNAPLLGDGNRRGHVAASLRQLGRERALVVRIAQERDRWARDGDEGHLRVEHFREPDALSDREGCTRRAVGCDEDLPLLLHRSLLSFVFEPSLAEEDRAASAPHPLNVAGNPQVACGSVRMRCAFGQEIVPGMTTGLTTAPALADVVLRDGSTMRFRPPGTDDAARLLSFFRRLSDQSLYLRFHGHPSVGPQLVEPMLEPDWVERGALVGLKSDVVVAAANYVRLRDPRTAEVAFAVSDELQSRGIATRLLEQLAGVAATVGIEEFVAEVMLDNGAMLRVFADAGFETTRETVLGTAEVHLALAPTDTLRARVDERDHVGVVSSLQPFFEPQTVAVVGASPRTGSIGGELFRNVLRAEFRGVCFPVNRSGTSVAGVRAYRGVGEIGEAVDLAVICLPGPAVLEAAEEALAAGVRALCVVSAGFAEVGAEGAARQEELVALVRAHGARLLGPNCLGIATAGPQLNATFGPRALPAGNVGFSSQSGALGLAVLERATERRLGLSAFVSVGNKADISSNDLLEYWEDDPSTDVVLLYLESFGNPRKFARVARRVARTKPIVAMKAGRTGAGARAASSHTAALAGSEAAVDALFHQAGVLRVDTLEELLDVTGLLAGQPLPHGRNVAVLTNAGGLGILCADACEAAGLKLPPLSDATVAGLKSVLPSEASLSNPVDMLGSAVGSTYEQALPLLLRDSGVDAVIVLFVPPVVAGADEIADAIARAVQQVDRADKPVLASIITSGGTPESLLAAPVASFAYPESAARALGRAAARFEWLRRPQGRVTELEGIDESRAAAIVRDAGERWLTAGEARGLLESYGVPLVPERTAATIDDAVAAAHELGYPVVLKTAEAGVHKTDVGGVALDLRDEQAVREAAERIGAPLIVQPLVRGGVELLVGAVEDPVFGPLVALGPGGTLAELIGAASFRLAPLTDADADELVQGEKVSRLLGGFRGAPAANSRAVTNLLLRVARLVDDLPDVAELDLNPVIAGPRGCVAVDARVRVAAQRHTARAKTW
jgi:acetyl coenzyme A synthetase (ADP forming)-like protein